MLANKTTVLAKRASEIAALKSLIGTPVSPTEAQLAAMDTIADLRSRKRPIPADVDTVAKSFDPAANSSFEHTTGFLFGLILELADAVDAATPAPATTAPATTAPATTAPATTAPAVPPILQ